MRPSGRFSQTREVLLIAVPMLLLVGGLAWLALSFAGSAPPSRFVIATASKGSPYFRLAQRYEPLFKKNNIALEVRETGGSFDNLALLDNAGSGVDAAFVQGGLPASRDAKGLLSVGRVAYEPLWVFHNANTKLERLADLVGKKILVGPAGGGTNSLALQLLAANGVSAENSSLINRELPDYVDLLARGEADAGFLVLAAEARTVQRLLANSNVKLFNFANADAYTQKFPFLSKLELREGVVDLGQRIPPRDTTLIATTTAVVVRDGAHHALVNLLAQAIAEAHSSTILDAAGQAALFQRTGDFPTQTDPEFHMSDDARRVYRSGAPMLQRYVPFWVANLVDRLLVSLVVLVPLLIPLSRLGPQIYRWRVRRRLLHWYGVLKRLEARVKSASTNEERAAGLAELDDIESAVDNIPVPLGFADQHFELRQHIDAVRSRLTGRQQRHLSPDQSDGNAVVAGPAEAQATPVERSPRNDTATAAWS